MIPPHLRGDTRVSRVAVHHGTSRLTYGELAAGVQRSAGWLAAQGMGPGDVLALQLPKGRAFLELHLAALATQLVTLPLNPRYSDQEVAFVLQDADARRVVRDPSVQDELDRATPLALPERAADEALAMLCYTSGTTGRPKGARLSHGNLRAGVAALHQAWRWRGDDVLVHALPLFHIHGLLVAQHGALHAGAQVVWLDRFSPEGVIAALVAGGTIFMGVPTFYHRLVAYFDHHGAPDLSHVRLFTSGSAPLSAATHRAFEAHTGHTIVERYGMTEVGIVISNPYQGERRPGCIGLPLPGVEARVTEGELYIKGPSVFAGYHGLPARTAEVLQDGWMRTGDLASVDPDGYLRLHGRRGDLILSGGFNIYPREVEDALCALPGVQEAAVVGVPDPDLGERPVATVVGQPSDDVLEQLRARLTAYKCPRQLRWVDALPRNAMNKVLKAEVRAAWCVPTLRPATTDDVDALVAGNLAMARETEALCLDADTVARGVRGVFEAEVGARYFVATLAGQQAGQLMITTEWSDWRAAVVWWIQSVYVPPVFRRLGIYRALYKQVMRAAKAEGAAGVRLYVDQRNGRASEVYARLGMDGDHYRVFEQLFDVR